MISTCETVIREVRVVTSLLGQALSNLNSVPGGWWRFDSLIVGVKGSFGLILLKNWLALAACCGDLVF